MGSSKHVVWYVDQREGGEAEPPAGVNAHYNNSCSRPDDSHNQSMFWWWWWCRSVCGGGGNTNTARDRKAYLSMCVMCIVVSVLRHSLKSSDFFSAGKDKITMPR